MSAVASIGWNSRVIAGCGIVGTSLGSCYAFIAAAHDPRIRVAAFNHASTYVADVVWHGQSTRHIRQGMEAQITLETLRQSWLAVSPMAYFNQFSRWPRRSLIIYAKYDLTFLPELSRDVVNEFKRRELDHKVVVLPCGHYTMGETPYKYMDGWQLASFLRTAFEDCVMTNEEADLYAQLMRHRRVLLDRSFDLVCHPGLRANGAAAVSKRLRRR